MKVSLVKDWNFPDVFRQTPGGRGVWEGITFMNGVHSEADYLVVLNRPPNLLCVKCPKNRRLLLTQEPPVEFYQWHKKSFPYFGKIFSHHAKDGVNNIIHCQTALPWHINKSYDELMALSHPNWVEKENGISWITSNAGHGKPGYQTRLQFIDFLQQRNFPFTLLGRGFKPIEDKFDGIFPFRYSIAMENSSFPDYWTEKLADCFLSWSMPIYYGCPNITDYFPAESMILINPREPEEALEKMRSALSQDLWTRNLEAVAEARNLILNKYQLFPFVTEQIRLAEKENTVRSNFFSKWFQRQTYSIPQNPWPSPKNNS